MSNLFAAVDDKGDIRFIGDVPRGLACGCFCPTCASPLVAKQGNLNEWHFAHEAGQERPECLVGAINLLRRLAIERTTQCPPSSLPAYRKLLQIQSISGILQSEASWSVTLEETWKWDLQAGHGHPVANTTIAPGVALDLYIDIGTAATDIDMTGRLNRAAIVLCVPIPPPSTLLRTREQAVNFIEANCSLVWRHMPDLFGIEARAMATLRQRDEEDRERHKQFIDQRARMAGQRWAQIRDRLEGRSPHPAGSEVGQAPGHGSEPARPENDPHAHAGHAAHSKAQKASTYPWAPEAKPNASFVFFRLKDGSAWVLYPRAAGGCGIAPWGTAQETEGWDEALPPSIGTPDCEAGLYRADDSLGAIIFFNRNVAITRSSSNPADFEGL